MTPQEQLQNQLLKADRQIGRLQNEVRELRAEIKRLQEGRFSNG